MSNPSPEPKTNISREDLEALRSTYQQAIRQLERDMIANQGALQSIEHQLTMIAPKPAA